MFRVHVHSQYNLSLRFSPFETASRLFKFTRQIFTRVEARKWRGASLHVWVAAFSSAAFLAAAGCLTTDRLTTDRLTTDRRTEDRLTTVRLTTVRLTTGRRTTDRHTTGRLTTVRLTRLGPAWDPVRPTHRRRRRHHRRRRHRRQRPERLHTQTGPSRRAVRLRCMPAASRMMAAVVLW